MAEEPENPVVAAFAKAATKRRFEHRLATAEQRNGYEVGWYEGYLAAGGDEDERAALQDLVRWVLFPTEEKDAPWSQGIIDRCLSASERFNIQREGTAS